MAVLIDIDHESIVDDLGDLLRFGRVILTALLVRVNLSALNLDRIRRSYAVNALRMVLS